MGGLAQIISPKLDGGHTTSLLKLQGSMLSMVVQVITGHCIVKAHVRSEGEAETEAVNAVGETGIIEPSI